MSQDLCVERPRQATVTGDSHDRGALHLAPLEEGQTLQRRARPRGADHQLHHPVGVGPHRLDPGLGPPQPRGGHELEGLRDLLRVADRADPPLQVLDGCH
jgi:hypothetical protein